MSNSSSKQKLNVTIYGQHYAITGDESTDHIRHVASIVDDKMKEINKKNPLLDTNKLAVLTALNIVSDYVKLKERANMLEKLLEKQTKSEQEKND